MTPDLAQALTALGGLAGMNDCNGSLRTSDIGYEHVIEGLIAVQQCARGWHCHSIRLTSTG